MKKVQILKTIGNRIVEYMLMSIALAFAISSTYYSGANVIACISGTMLFILFYVFWSWRQETTLDPRN